jgi:sigma-E factor negative regulatory protein RseA
MNPMQESTREQVSALADGALRGDELVRAVQTLCTDDSLQASWRAYHDIGDVLAAGTRQTCTGSAAFLARFQQRLAADVEARPLSAAVAAQAEIAVEPVTASAAPVQAVVVPFPEKATRLEAANEPVFRWKLVAGVASLAAVAAIGWNLMGTASAPSAGAQLALQQPRESRQIAPVVAASVPQVGGGASVANAQSAEPMLAASGQPQTMLRDPRLDQLLEAHRQAGGAAQMPSGFLRNATFDGPER